MFLKQRIITRIKNYLFRRGKATTELSFDMATKLQLKDPEETLEGEVVQSISFIDLAEQLHIIQTVKDYMKNFVMRETYIDPTWTSGYALKNELFVAIGEETVYRSNLEVFFQEKESGHRKLDFMVSLIKFQGDPWRVFQFKEKSLEVIFANV